MAKFEVTYKIPTLGNKYYKRVVECLYQHEAIKMLQAEIPSAIICGGGRRLNG